MSDYLNKNELSTGDLKRLIKSEAKRLQVKNGKDRKLKYYQNYVAKRYGYENYDQLHLKSKSELEAFISEGQIECATKITNDAKEYYFVTAHEDWGYSYYSHWTGWDAEGYELRAPSIINASYFVKLIRETLLENLYIVETNEEFFKWMFLWKGKALVESQLVSQTLTHFLTPSRSYDHPPIKCLAEENKAGQKHG